MHAHYATCHLNSAVLACSLVPASFFVVVSRRVALERGRIEESVPEKTTSRYRSRRFWEKISTDLNAISKEGERERKKEKPDSCMRILTFALYVKY